MGPQSMGSEWRGTSNCVCTDRHCGTSCLTNAWPQTLRYPWICLQQDRAAA